MKKYLILLSILCVSVMAFEGYAHDSCNTCPMCNFFSEEGLVEKSKEELLKIKESIEQHFSKDNLSKLGSDTIESLQKVLDKVNDKLKEK